MKSSKTFLKISFSICVVLAVAFYFAGCSDKDDDDKYLAFLTPTGTGTGTGTTPPGPVANFVGSPTIGSAPLTANFTDLSQGTVTGWSWDFGDSGTSMVQNPSHIYNSDGLYTVSLTITGPAGSDTETKADYVFVGTGSIYYIDAVAGSDGNPGTDTQPWQTMGKVATDAQMGDTIVILNVHEDTFTADWPEGLIYRSPGVTQWGITWTFDQNYQIGRFTNGDYWVVGPVTFVRIDPVSTEYYGETSDGSTRIMHGSMVNPVPVDNTVQGYDTYMYVYPNNYPDNYDPNLNSARPGGQDLSAGNPLILQADSSLISVISRTLAELQAASDPKQNLKAAAILTVLDSPAPAGGFRPPYCGADKTIKFNKSQLDYSVFANLAPVAGAPRLEQQPGDGQGESVERMFERPWIDHKVPTWSVGYSAPYVNMPGYGREMSTQVGIGAVMLNLNLTNQQKEKLLIRFVQVGIDLTGVFDDGGWWRPLGGILCGRKIPVLVAGLALDDPHMKNVGYWTTPGYNIYGTSDEGLPFQEDAQTFYVEETSPGVYNYGFGGYTAGDVGLPAWGKRHWHTPPNDDRSWDASYRTVNGCSWAGIVLAAHIMGAKELWNHDALFDYYDRFMEVELQVHGKGDWHRQQSDFLEDMWDTYRTDYRPVWTRNNPADIYSQGHHEY